jgi:glutathione S-transferase
MKATLFGVPASHPALAAQLMLERKGIEVRRIDLVPAVHRALIPRLGFPGDRVPAVRIDGARVQGTARIARALDALVPEPPLLPSDPDRRAAVERAEAWGDEVLQPVARRLVWAALKCDRSGVASYLQDQRTGLPTPVAVATARPVAWLARRVNGVDDQSAREDLRLVPQLIERVDELLSAGTIGGDELNVADFQIGTSVRLLMTMDDLLPLIEGRPAAEHARRVAPHYPGRVPPVFPSGHRPTVDRSWKQPLRSGRPASGSSATGS